MQVINFFGAPGAGKSTAALGLAHLLKRAWVRCEYVSEFAKGQVWSESAHLLSHQNWVFANQEFPLNNLQGKVDFAVCDSPLLISAFYAPAHYPESFQRLCFDFFNTYDNLNFFINRSHRYESVGRMQDEAQSDAIAEKMKQWLRANGVAFVEFDASDSVPQRIFDQLRQSGRVTSDPTILD